jgi:hypothetical protein
MNMTKLVAVGLPTRDDVEKLLLTGSLHKYTVKDGEPSNKVLMISLDGQGLGLMDLATREVHTTLPFGDIGPVDLLPVLTVTEEMLADPMLNPAQEEEARTLVAYTTDRAIQNSEQGKFSKYSRIPGTDRFISCEANPLIPDSMSYGDSNVRSLVEAEAERIKDSVLLSCRNGAVYNIARPEEVYCMEPGYEITFADAERTPENDSYPNIINPELKPPEHEALIREVEPVREREWLEQFHEHKAAWEAKNREKEADKEDIGEEAEVIEDDELGLG